MNTLRKSDKKTAQSDAIMSGIVGNGQLPF